MGLPHPFRRLTARRDFRRAGRQHAGPEERPAHFRTHFPHPNPCQNSLWALTLACRARYAALRYSLIRPPMTCLCAMRAVMSGVCELPRVFRTGNLVGWPRGISPLGSRRSRRNSLPLPGSSCSHHVNPVVHFQCGRAFGFWEVTRFQALARALSHRSLRYLRRSHCWTW
jgi:hypothetical protein